MIVKLETTSGFKKAFKDVEDVYLMDINGTKNYAIRDHLSTYTFEVDKVCKLYVSEI